MTPPPPRRYRDEDNRMDTTYKITITETVKSRDAQGRPVMLVKINGVFPHLENSDITASVVIRFDDFDNGSPVQDIKFEDRDGEFTRWDVEYYYYGDVFRCLEDAAKDRAWNIYNAGHLLRSGCKSEREESELQAARALLGDELESFINHLNGDAQ